MSDFIAYFMATAFAILPAGVWLIIWYRKDFLEPEPQKLVLRSFLFGCLGVIPFLGIKYALENSPNLIASWEYFAGQTMFLSMVILTFVLALLEESVKHFAVLRLGSALKLEFNQIVDGIIYSVSAALGFAFMENLFLFFNFLMNLGFTGEFLLIFAFRSLGTMLAHTIFSGVFGLFWGYAMFSIKATPRHSVSVAEFFRKFWQTIRFHIVIRHIFKQGKCQKNHEKQELVAEGLWAAVLLHAIFNLLLVVDLFGQSLTCLIVPLIIGGFGFLSYAFLNRYNLKIWQQER
jgi:RsiW-degrading membrane proteinase PrsW (M82 family)